MAHSSFAPSTSHARGYNSFALGPPEPAPTEASDWLHAAGGLNATASDLAKWDLALTSGKLLKPDSYRLMTAPRVLADGRMEDYGCGIGLTRARGEAVLRHSGAVGGFISFNAVAPRVGAAVVLLSNSEHPEVRTIFSQVLALLLKDLEAEGHGPPKVEGLATKEAAGEMMRALQSGKLERAKLGDDFSKLVDDEHARAAATRLKPLGEPTRIDVENVGERGGMEVSTVRFTFEKKKLVASMYRTPDGKVQQFLVSEAP